MYYLNFLIKSPEKEKPKQRLIIHKSWLIMYQNGKDRPRIKGIKLNAMEL